MKSKMALAEHLDWRLHPVTENLSLSPGINERKFRMLVEAVRDYAIYVLDTEGRVCTWNSGAQRNKGYSDQEIIGKHFRQFFRAEDVATGLPESILETARSTGHYAGEGWRVRKDGTLFWASVVVNVIRDEEGTIAGFAKVTRDLTERRRQEEELRASKLALEAERDRLAVTLYSIGDAVISTDEKGIITLMNPAAEAMTG